MDEERAREILGETIGDDGRLRRLKGGYISSSIGGRVVLDGDFTADELEAIAWWMKNMDDHEETKRLEAELEALGPEFAENGIVKTVLHERIEQERRKVAEEE